MISDGQTEERVMVFMDLANTERRVRNFNLKNLILDYRDLLEQLTGERRLVKAIVYDSCIGESDGKWPFLRYLENIGFDLVIRTYLHSERVQKEVDVAMATGMLTEAYCDSFDTAIVMSGDRDFLPALEVLKQMDKRVEVASFMATASNAMIDYSDRFINMDKLLIFDPSRCEVPDRTTFETNKHPDACMVRSRADIKDTQILAHGAI